MADEAVAAAEVTLRNEDAAAIGIATTARCTNMRSQR